MMANPVLLQKVNGSLLWRSLLALGFQSDTLKTNVKHLTLGTNMFDIPNKDAFHIVTHFLLEKLNHTRFCDAYRHCWPVLDYKMNAEFRKVTCAWLREIMDEKGSSAPNVVASLFQSPGGARFTSLMLHLAQHVMLQDMKRFSVDGSWVPEAAGSPASSVLMATHRFHLNKSRLVKTAVDQDHALQEYQRRAQSRVKSLRDERANGAKYDDLLKRHKGDSSQEETSPAQRIHKVRSLWSTVTGMLSSIREPSEVVECVLSGTVDQYTLDGARFTLQVPQLLLERLERLPQHSSVGKLYEGGQLNLLAVLELMTHALRLLREEWLRVDGHTVLSRLQLHHLQEKSLQMARALEDLCLMRQRVTREEIPKVGRAIKTLEVKWDRKWMEILRVTPLTSFLNEDPALRLLSPMAPLSFEPATEASSRSCIFSRYPAQLPEFSEEEPAETKPHKEVTSICSLNQRFSPPPPQGAETGATEACAQPSSTPQPSTPQPSTPQPSTPPPSTPQPSTPQPSTPQPSTPQPSTPHHKPLTPPVALATPPPQKASVRKTRVRASAKRDKAEILHWEYDNLATQFAEAVTTTTPMGGRVRGLELETLLSTMGTDPFSTKKQLPRTPESLISDVKSSWRQAVEEDEALRAQRSLPCHGEDVSTGPLRAQRSLPCHGDDVSTGPLRAQRSLPCHGEDVSTGPLRAQRSLPCHGDDVSTGPLRAQRSLPCHGDDVSTGPLRAQRSLPCHGDDVSTGSLPCHGEDVSTGPLRAQRSLPCHGDDVSTGPLRAQRSLPCHEDDVSTGPLRAQRSLPCHGEDVSTGPLRAQRSLPCHGDDVSTGPLRAQRSLPCHGDDVSTGPLRAQRSLPCHGEDVSTGPLRAQRSLPCHGEDVSTGPLRAQRSLPCHRDDVSTGSLPCHGEDVSMALLAPLAEEDELATSPGAAVYLGALPVHQRRVSLVSMPSWNSSYAEALHSLSGTDPSHFSLDHETLPELPSLDLDDSEEVEEVEEEEEEKEEEEKEEEFLLPDLRSLKTEVNTVLLTARQRLDQIRRAYSDTSFVDGRKTAPESLPSRSELAEQDSTDWLTADMPETSLAANSSVFSLDLDAIESSPPQSRERYTLPQLITFSPIDDR